MKIGIVGVGVVGSAMHKLCLHNSIDVVAYDINREGFKEYAGIPTCDLVFWCLPTPTENGKQNLDALRATAVKMKGFTGVICIKSTVLPGTCEYLKENTNLRITHNPEFLTAANAYVDLIDSRVTLISGNEEDTKLVELFYRKVLPHSQLISLPYLNTTETIKYVHNCYLAMKVTFFNDIYDYCQEANVNFEAVRLGVISVGKVSPGHTKVPGPDGKKGYGGVCFPKDVVAFFNHCGDKYEMYPETIEATAVGNIRRRREEMDLQWRGYEAKGVSYKEDEGKRAKESPVPSMRA